MTEENKGEWNGGQSARSGDDAGADAGINTAPQYLSPSGTGVSADSSNASGSAAFDDASTAPTEVLNAGYGSNDVNVDNGGSLTSFDSAGTPASGDSPTEPIAAPAAQPDAATSAETPAAASAPAPVQEPESNNPHENPYSPAPEYGAYGPVPVSVDRPSDEAPTSQTAQWGGYAGGAGAQSPNNVAGQAGNFNGAGFGGPGAPGGPMNGGNNGFGGYGSGQPRMHANIITAIVTAVVTAALCLGIMFAAISNGWISVPSAGSMSGIASNKSGSGSATVKGGQAPDWVAVSQKVSDSVVSITTQASQGIAKGSGAVIDDKGHVITNNHVVSGGKNIQITLSNGQMYTATIVGSDNTTDLAVLQIQNAPSDLKPIEFGDSSKLAVGEDVMAVGNPLGYDDTATTGIVSALNRPVSVMDDNNSEIVTNAVQIDAAINPGNSGGPTFNVAGQVIGINSSIASASSTSGQAGSIGIGFAIPSNLVKRVADEIVAKGSVEHAMLGVTIKSATAEADGITRGGAQVTAAAGGSAVVSGSPADKAGIKTDDTIVAFNDQAVGSSAALLGYVRAASLGDQVKLTLVRGGKTMDVDVTLDQKESDVKGGNRSEKLKPKQRGNGNGQQDQQGQGEDGDGDDGGLFDPFGLW
ncbi:putative serine protease PepD [Bifidobacterium commune]|uniref:Putative serine protease PepD n=1 Tax=Bifidobacterium commune TaxID=1505727 RepID=A0A1C4H6A8_9BIFI|nr:trypsin-like peptidase domain-containing protein [Bifidobacterium commune]MBB2955633.1 putative serine protease PepD [Bifidobacterium commune]SCC80427.1 putative serine protease PepD [Bifidobacterium commune]